MKKAEKGSPKERLVTLFVEGATEVEFYKELINKLHGKNGGKLGCKIIYRNVKGVGNYKKRVVRIMEKEIIQKNPDCEYVAVLCYDTDVFHLQAKPPVKWSEVIKELKHLGVSQVLQLQADRSIEDWFLIDREGLRAFLKLPKSFKMKKYTGLQGLQDLFERSNKTYIKGGECKGLVKALDMDKILSQICPQLQKLCKLIGIDCTRGERCTLSRKTSQKKK